MAFTAHADQILLMNSDPKLPNSTNPYQADPQFQPNVPPMLPPNEGDATGGLIPYKNQPALISYYLGIFSLFPLLGIPFGVASIILGMKGLKKKNENPAVKGTAHAIIGIVLGSVQFLYNLPLTLAIIAGIIAAANGY